MDFTLDKKHEMARGLFRDFAETEVKPLAQETDETEQFPAETVAKMAKYGFMGIPVPKAILPRMEVRLANTAEPAAYRSQLLPAFAAPSDCFFSIIR